jgi:hypothetical protein
MHTHRGERRQTNTKYGNWSPLLHGVLDGPVQTGRTSRADPDDLFRTFTIACRKQERMEMPLGNLGLFLLYWLHFLQLLALCSGEIFSPFLSFTLYIIKLVQIFIVSEY